MKKPHPGQGAAGTTQRGAVKNIVPRLSCSVCQKSVIPLVYPSGPHLRADCPDCRRYLCFVPRRAPWLVLLDTPPKRDAPLFGVEL